MGSGPGGRPTAQRPGWGQCGTRGGRLAQRPCPSPRGARLARVPSAGPRLRGARRSPRGWRAQGRRDERPRGCWAGTAASPHWLSVPPPLLRARCLPPGAFVGVRTSGQADGASSRGKQPPPARPDTAPAGPLLRRLPSAGAGGRQGSPCLRASRGSRALRFETSLGELDKGPARPLLPHSRGGGPSDGRVHPS